LSEAGFAGLKDFQDGCSPLPDAYNPVNPQIVKILLLTISKDENTMTAAQDIPEIKLLEYRMTLGMTTMEGRGFYYPMDTAIADDGRMYVANRSLENVARGVRVTVCDIDSEYYGTFAAYGQSPGQFIWPSACTLDSRGRVYVSDEATHRISVFDREGALLSVWGEHGSDEGQLDTPSGLAFDADDNLYVADTYNNRVQKFTADGEFIMEFGSSGCDNGQFNRPTGIAVDHFGEIYVADTGNDRVQLFNEKGEYVQKFLGDATLSRVARDYMLTNAYPNRLRDMANMEEAKLLRAPKSVRVDDEGRMYVPDYRSYRVQVYLNEAIPLDESQMSAPLRAPTLATV
jgi:DNA-binding beta-propeller fold protein YncE